MQRRDFITLLGGAAAAWPLAARAQQDGRVRRIAILNGFAEGEASWPETAAALREGLRKLGWIEGRNLRTDVRHGAGDADRLRAMAIELVSLGPDVIVTNSGASTRIMRRQTQTIPIVFTGSGDPVATGLVENIARPESNVTGFVNLHASIGGKWLELLKETVPSVTRVMALFNPDVAAGSYFPAIETAAAALATPVTKAPVRTAVDIVRAVDAFAAEPNGGLIAVPPPVHAETIVELATQHRLPTVYGDRATAVTGGLMAYASDPIDRARGAASYVDRLLRGAAVNELPVQFPTKFKLVINLKTAKAIGLTVPDLLLVRADEVIE